MLVTVRVVKNWIWMACQLSAKERAFLGATTVETKSRFGRQDGMSGSVKATPRTLKDHLCSVELEAECLSSILLLGSDVIQGCA